MWTTTVLAAFSNGDGLPHAFCSYLCEFLWRRVRDAMFSRRQRHSGEGWIFDRLAGHFARLALPALSFIDFVDRETGHRELLLLRIQRRLPIY